MSDGWGSGTKPVSELVAGKDFVKVGGRYELVTHLSPVNGQEGWMRVATAHATFVHPDGWPVEWMGAVEVDEARS